MTKYIPATEVAKMARKTLKDAFPGQKFSVRTSSGRCLDIQWVDGPARKAVDALVHQYAGESFDGMTDMRSYNDNGTDETGEAISYGTSFVFCERHLSPELDHALRMELAQGISDEAGTPIGRVLESNNYWTVPQVYMREVQQGPWEMDLYTMVRRLAEFRAERAVA
jgi:hypothetical protein